MEKIAPYYTHYNTIITAYNELGLKSKQVRNRMERTLIEHIKQICARENIAPNIARRDWGRFIFQFPHENMTKAIHVFRHLIGILHFMPCIEISRDYSEIEKTVRMVAQTLFQKGKPQSFAIKAKRVKPYPKTTMEIGRDIGSLVVTDCEKRGIPLTVNLSNPDNTIYIEIRTDRAYIYTHMVPTIWGGNPIESDKAMLSVYSSLFENDYQEVAAQLLIRRGTIIIPLIFTHDSFSIDNMDKINENLKNQEIFYPKRLNRLIINIQPLLDWFYTKLNASNNGPCSKFTIQSFTELQILELLQEKLKYDLKVRYGNSKSNLKPKAFITNITSLENQECDLLPYLKMAHENSLVHLMPLSGLSKNAIGNMQKLLSFQTFSDIQANTYLDLIHRKEKFDVLDTLLFDSLETNTIESKKEEIPHLEFLVKDEEYLKIIDEIFEGIERNRPRNMAFF